MARSILRKASRRTQSLTTTTSPPSHLRWIFLEGLWNTPLAHHTMITPLRSIQTINIVPMRQAMLQAAITTLIQDQFRKYSHLKRPQAQVLQQMPVDDPLDQTWHTILVATVLEPQVPVPMQLTPHVRRAQALTSLMVDQGLRALGLIWLTEGLAPQAPDPMQPMLPEAIVQVPTLHMLPEAIVRVPTLHMQPMEPEVIALALGPHMQPTVRGQPAPAPTTGMVAAQAPVQITLVSSESIGNHYTSF